MQIPLQITFRHLEHSDAIEADIRDRAQKLERFANDITGCRVVVEAPHKHHHKGRIYTVSIDVTVPGAEIVASRHPDKHHAHEDAYVAIRDAFDAVQRQLEDYVRERCGKVKSHASLPHGEIMKLVPEENYGLIKDTAGREIYFHRNSVIDEDFDRLETGMKVHFNEEQGEQGLQASTVHVEGKHHVT